jgi:hypothetical protein
VILEIGKSYINKFYGGDVCAAVKEKDGILWTPEKIKAAFNNGNGSIKDLKNYISNNKKYAYFVEV